MGLPGFVSTWMKRKYGKDPRFAGIFMHRTPKDIHTLAIDMNGMIHAGFSLAWGLERNKNNPERTKKMISYSASKRLAIIFRSIFAILERTIEAIAPENTLLISVDSITPEAKMFQQRDRRFKSVVQSDGKRPDTSFITVGTDFMRAFDVALRAYFIDKRHLFPPRIVYSNYLVPGEGEAKIMEYLRTHSSGNVAIYGLDADLAMLSLISPQSNIYLIREDVRNVLNIDILKRAIIDETPPEIRTTALKDFVALLFHLGNDFLPSGPLHESTYDIVEGLLKSYYKVGKSLTVPEGDISTIDFAVMGQILSVYGETEALLCAKESVHTDYSYNENRFILAGLKYRLLENTDRSVRYFDYITFRSVWYNNEFFPVGQENEWGIDIPLPSAEDVEEMCRRYCEGLAWTFRYYQTTQINTQWYFPYHHAPLKMDLATYLTGIGNEERMSLVNKAVGDGKINHTPLEQLLSVMHPNSVLVSIPDFAAQLVIDPYSPLADMYPVGMIVEKDGVPLDMSYVYRGIQTLLDIERVKDAIGQHIDMSILQHEFNLQDTIIYEQKNDLWEARLKTFRSKRRQEKPPTTGPTKEKEVAPPLDDIPAPVVNYPVIAGKNAQPRGIRGKVSKQAAQGFALRGMRTQYGANVVAPPSVKKPPPSEPPSATKETPSESASKKRTPGNRKTPGNRRTPAKQNK